ncbi:MAG: hypothetical protein ACOY90_00710 [Candidatus Zhuqueibacterota bacterium]
MMTNNGLALIIALAFANFTPTDVVAQKQDTANSQTLTRSTRIDSSETAQGQDKDGLRIAADSTQNRQGSARTIRRNRVGKLPDQMGRSRDKFIDRNGDGICDGRESALGLKKMYRLRKGGMNAAR